MSDAQRSESSEQSNQILNGPQTNITGDVHSPVLSGQFNAPVQVGDVIHQVVQGYGELSTRYDGRVRNFLEHYLGTPENPAPFGGRAEALQLLNAWLDDPRSPRYALLAAPAGRGKSALLAHWVSQLAQRPEAPHIIYFPISIRFNTNLEGVVFAALAARAANLLGEKVAMSSDAQQYRGLFADYVRRPPPNGRPLLVILDGLDESAAWELGQDVFPPQAPGHLRVLVAARPLAGDVDSSGWLRRLGWERPGQARCPALEPLTQAGVADVLAHMGNPLAQLSVQFDIITRLHELSEGDPLLVRLYVEALTQQAERAAFLRPDDLLQLKPGLDTYFKAWFDEQHKLWGAANPLAEKRVRGLLNVCATALGPLLTDDVRQLAPDYLEDNWLVEEAARAVNRFVIGDGITLGYTYSHPRLADYFARRLGGDAAIWRARFLRYGRETLTALQTKTLDPKDAPAYAVQHYAAHLKQANAAPAELYALVCGEWAQAWEALDGTYAGFVSDVEQAWAMATQKKAISMQLKCALCQASLAALSRNTSAELLALTMTNNVLTIRQGLVYLQQITDMDEAFERLVELTVRLPDEQLREALAMAQTMGGWLPAWGGVLLGFQAAIISASEVDADENAKAILARDLVKVMPTNFQETNRVLVQDLEDMLQSLVYIGLLKFSSPAQRLSLGKIAMEAAGAIRDENVRAGIFFRLAPHLPTEQRPLALSAMLDAARATESGSTQAWVVIGLAPYLAADLLNVTLETVGGINDDRERVRASIGLAPYLPAGQRNLVLNAALEVALTSRGESNRLGDRIRRPTEMPIESVRAEALIELAAHLPAEQRTLALNTALETASAIQDEYARTKALTGLAPHFPAEQRTLALNAALETIRAMQTEYARAKALTNLAPHLPADLSSAALEVALMIQSDSDRAKALTSLAPHLPIDQQAPTLGTALQAAREIESENARAEALTNLAPHLPADLSSAALEDALMIQTEYARAKALTSLAPYLPIDQQAPTLGTALQAARAIESDSDRVEALTSLAPYLPIALLNDALEAALAIESENTRAKALTGLAPHLPAEQRAIALSAALQAAHAIRDENNRTNSLLWLIPYLSTEQRSFVVSAALKAAHAIESEAIRARMLTRLAPHLPAEQRALALSAALEAIRAMQDQSARGGALTELAPCLSADLSSAALEVALTIESEIIRARVLTDLIPHLPAGQRALALSAALEAVRAIQDEIDLESYWNSMTLSAPRPAESARAKALTELAPYLSADLLSAALEVAHTIESDIIRARALTGLIPHLPVEQRTLALSTALETTRAIENDTARAGALTDLAPYLSADLSSAALEVALAFKAEGTRARALTELASHLPAGQRTLALNAALEAARAIYGASDQAEALTGLAPHLSAEQRTLALNAALETARAIRDASSRAEALTGLAPHLSAEQRAMALSAALEAAYTSEGDRVGALTRLAPYLSAEQRTLALNAALEASRAIRDESTRAEALTWLAPHLSAVQRAMALSAALEAAYTIESEGDRVGVLTRLAPHLSAEQRTPALNAALEAIRAMQGQGDQGDALTELAPHLPVGLLSAALETAHAIEDESARARALAGLALGLENIFPSQSEKAYALWNEVLHDLAHRPRPDFLESLQTVMPVTLKLVPESERGQLATEIAQAIVAVSQWWP